MNNVAFTHKSFDYQQKAIFIPSHFYSLICSFHFNVKKYLYILLKDIFTKLKIRNKVMSFINHTKNTINLLIKIQLIKILNKSMDF